MLFFIDVCHLLLTSLLNPPELVKEYQKDEYRTDISDAEEVYAEEPCTHGAAVGKLITHQMARQMPTHIEAGEETAHGKDNLAGEKVEKVEQRFSGNLQSIASP